MAEHAGSYGVVWREPGNGLATGKLVLRADELQFDGTSQGRLVRRRVRFEDLAAIRIGRSVAERIRDRPTLVLDRRGAAPLIVEPIGAGLLSELADTLAELSTLHGERIEHVAFILPLRPEAIERARRLIEEGPPFDPAEAGLGRHHVFVSDQEAVFVFEGANVRETARRLLRTSSMWRLTAAWAACLAGRPRLAEAAYAWPASTHSLNV